MAADGSCSSVFSFVCFMSLLREMDVMTQEKVEEMCLKLWHFFGVFDGNTSGLVYCCQFLSYF